MRIFTSIFIRQIGLHQVYILFLPDFGVRVMLAEDTVYLSHRTERNE